MFQALLYLASFGAILPGAPGEKDNKPDWPNVVLIPGLPPYVAVPHLRGGTDNFFHYAAYLGAGANPLNVEPDPNLPTAIRFLSLRTSV